MGKLVIGLFQVCIFLFARSLASSSVATGSQEIRHGDLVLVQKFTAIQFGKRRKTAQVPYLPSSTSGRNYIDWDLCNKSYKSNLGGLGPDTDAPEELRFYNITDEGSEGSIDLVITATSEYTAKTVDNNGVHGCFGVINVKSSKTGTNSVNFDFSTYKTGTYDPVSFSLQYFTLFDMDESDTAVESITLYDRVEEVFQYPDDELEMEGDLASGLTFTSTEFGVGADNPVSPMNLTETQLKRSVTVSYKEKHEWTVTFGVTGGSGGRNFMFAGRSQLAPTPSPTPAPTSAPTPAPTAALTSAPTPAPTAASTSAPTPAPTPVSTSGPPTMSPTDASSGFGDPHMVNINGEHFNIWRLGEVELLRIPRDPMHRAQIRFVAKVSNENEAQSGNGCTRAPYMTAMRLSGSWFGNRELFIRMVAGEMRVHVGSKNLSPLEKVPIEDNLIVSRPSEALVTVQAGNATINVMHDAFFKPYFYLNTEARNLGSLGSEIGGVLGLDDHTVVAQKPAGCEKQFVSVLPNVHGSHASASLQN